MHDSEPRSPGEHLTALTRLLESVGASPRSESLALGRAYGRILANSVIASEDSPRFDNSQMDGYALSAEANRSEDRTFVAGPVLPAGTDPARDYPRGLDRADLVCPIMTGSKLPEGTAAVVPVEKCNPPEFVAAGEHLQVPTVPNGQFLRMAGSDLIRGETLAPAGKPLSAQAIGVLASQGIATVEVWARPRVLICTGGEEVSADATVPLDNAQIPDANGPMLEALCQEHGLEIADKIVTGDDADQLRTRLEEAAQRVQPDLIVTSGGISHGKFEVVRQVLEAEAHAWFGHVAQQPGGPQGYATLSGVPVVALPGNPVSTLVSFRLFVAPLAARMWEAALERHPVTALVSQELRGIPGKTQFRRGRLKARGDATFWVQAVGGSGSHLLAQSVASNCLIEVPPEADLPRGSAVQVHPLTTALEHLEENS
ncbi:molybdopterin molybdotransferase MoeA [Rothia uropygialis]|uniref:molybdopterin molybdotransferase MoeA n=1 Tax=Kocuria sp. 36 TaxID=1415402 RepID=UPI00101B86B0|nr:gephyrin-like molybdotransferase Glp [Kocuria sp. 36]